MNQMGRLVRLRSGPWPYDRHQVTVAELAADIESQAVRISVTASESARASAGRTLIVFVMRASIRCSLIGYLGPSGPVTPMTEFARGR